MSGYTPEQQLYDFFVFLKGLWPHIGGFVFQCNEGVLRSKDGCSEDDIVYILEFLKKLRERREGTLGFTVVFEHHHGATLPLPIIRFTVRPPTGSWVAKVLQDSEMLSTSTNRLVELYEQM